MASGLGKFSGGLGRDAMGYGRRLGAATKPKTPTTPTTPNQWTFQPNPLDQPPQVGGPLPPANPGGVGSLPNNNPWAVSPPILPWMMNPMAGGWGQYQPSPFNWQTYMGQGQSPYAIQQPVNPAQPQVGGPLPPYMSGWGQPPQQQ